ncbi:hypothetical protein N7478_011555 [Penicillium angulare]|uniref:uncharacterized protein n=1 Tax=Penicillium angulare TaxID=116970 RepID=UPI002540050D|nr:uncharacterized protein N7478_011555 [Penicillium angulare]KAJ5263950.1 hypothetical protein N7478_011555 [Penicillium angulare]
MALTTFDLENASNAIRNSGFYCEKDPELRTPLLDMGPKSCLSEEGLEFCKLHVLRDNRVRTILESFLPWCSLGRYRKFHSDAGHIFQFRGGGEKAGRHVLVVQLWGEGSEVVFFNRSHTYELPGVHASNGLWEVPYAALESTKCAEGSEIIFQQGGITIQDARVAFEIRKGTPIATVFAMRDVITKWAKVVLPNTPQILHKVAELQNESESIGFHFEYDARK